jgi:hypothetical protein
MARNQMHQKSRWKRSLVRVSVPLLVASWSSQAGACGGFFCDSSNLVNQTAERIVFAKDSSGTVTQIVEVLYQGDAEKFAWILPVPGTPEPGVSSVQALDALQRNTNPSYSLSYDFEDCSAFVGSLGGLASPSSDEASGGDGDGDSSGPGGVTVLDSGKVGEFDYDTISVDDPENPAAAALTWLSENGYDVGDLGEAVLQPYLANGLNLIAFKLAKGASVGAIQPISLRFVPEEGAEASMTIPIRPTAVAAQDDMPVMVWVLGQERAVPTNYYGLELNELLINWFSTSATYNNVVTAAANEAGGQGFVTEYASDSHTFTDPVGYDREMSILNSFGQNTYGDNTQKVIQIVRTYSGYDGMLKLVQEHVPLRDGITAEQFTRYPDCYFGAESSYGPGSGSSPYYYGSYERYECAPFSAGLNEWGQPLPEDPIYDLDPEELLSLIRDEVIGPIRELDELIEELPYMTRLYTTMSASEMTKDPAFDFNADLEPVSNLHTADAYVYCDDSYSVTLSNGTKVFGSSQGVWPYAAPDPSAAEPELPANARVLSFSTSGQPKLVSNNTASISSAHEDNPAGSAPKGTDAYRRTHGCSISPGSGSVAPSFVASSFALLGLAAVGLRRRSRRELVERH